MPDTDAHTLGRVAELERMPRDLHTALAGEGFRKRRRMVLPLLTTDPEGFPRVALLTMGEVRANSASELAVAVRADSRTAFNLVRRGTATLLYHEPADHGFRPGARRPGPRRAAPTRRESSSRSRSSASASTTRRRKKATSPS